MVGGIGIDILAAGFAVRVFFVFRAGAATSAGDGPASAGLATSVPTATGIAGSARLLLRLAIVRAGAKLQGCAASTDDSVNLSFALLPRKETIIGVALASLPICNATAV